MQCFDSSYNRPCQRGYKTMYYVVFCERDMNCYNSFIGHVLLVDYFFYYIFATQKCTDIIFSLSIAKGACYDFTTQLVISCLLQL